MKKIIAACGLDCAACPAYIATATNDNALRKKTAEEWSGIYGGSISAETINCHGCFATDGVQFGHCSQCGMRKCVTDQKLANCAQCADYPCEQLSGFFAHVPMAKANLDELRK